MVTIIFLSAMSLILAAILVWGFKYLPGERWQMLAVVPRRKSGEKTWHGTNLTYYGFFVATSQLLSVILLLILLGTYDISIDGALVTAVGLILVCLPAARILAILVEKKRHTFTVGGAAFIGILLAPWCIYFTKQLFGILNYPIFLPLLPTLAAFAICYTLGEGLGRLGCISFGCCYGKQLCQCSSSLQTLFKRANFTFTAATKKAVYEGRLGGEQLVPIQAITAIIYAMTTVVTSGLYLLGMFGAALATALLVSQWWRILSELLRADFRGFGKISAYQKMSLLAIVYLVGLMVLMPDQPALFANLGNGFQTLWNPALILGMQLLWVLFFIFFGTSTITSATLQFDILEERV